MKQLGLLIICCSITAFGQVPEKKVFAKDVTFDRRAVEINGTVYLNKEFIDGYTLINGTKHLKFPMRYDAVRDNLEFLDKNGKLTILQERYAIEVFFDEKRFRYIDYDHHGNTKSGFFELRHENKETALFKKYRKKVFYHLPENGYDEHIPPEWRLEVKYYLKRARQPAIKLNDLSRKEVGVVLWDKYSQLRKYSRKNKLRMRDEKEVIQVLNHYDYLKRQDEIIKETEN